MPRCPRLVGAAASVLMLSGLIVVGTNAALTSTASASPPGTAMPLQEFVNDGAGGRLWNAYDQTTDSVGPTIDGRPSAITYGSTVHVDARAANGDLVEFDNDGDWGRVWNAYDLTQDADGPPISGDAGAIRISGSTVNVFAEASDGDLEEFVNNGAGGRLWNAYDLTEETGGPTLGGDPSPVLNGGVVDVLARSSSGDLVEYADDDAGGQQWNAYDLTSLSSGPSIAGDAQGILYNGSLQAFAEASGGDLTDFSQTGSTWSFKDVTAASNGAAVTGRPSPVVDGTTLNVYSRSTSGDLEAFRDNGGTWSSKDLTTLTSGPTIGGDPAAIVYSTSIHVYAESSSGGALSEFVNADGDGQTWTEYNLTNDAGGPAIGGDPNPIIYGVTIHIYAGGPPPAAPPSGVGLYGLDPTVQTPVAIEDDWPIIGDTGGLGTQSGPYTSVTMGSDLATGQDIAASGKRITWLSFWTVSGPVSSNSDGSACYTSSCYYSDAFGAGQYVASTINGYAGDGLNLKPDWVIIDPEGYPDNHSGLDSGPGATTANWISFLTGWANGIASVDSSLHAGFYADQSEYNNFDLSAIQLPAFVALAFPGPQNILDNMNNVEGFVAFGATCPAANEEQTLLNSPWGGSYNTLQFAGSQFCGP